MHIRTHLDHRIMPHPNISIHGPPSPKFSSNTSRSKSSSTGTGCSASPWPASSCTLAFVMVARVTVFMQGLGTFLQHPISVAKAWRPLAIEMLKDKEQEEPLGW